MKAASRNAGEVGDKHGDHGVALYVSRGNPGFDQRVLEGKAAAQQKRDEIIPPEVSDVATLLGQLAFPVDAVARKISAEVCPRG
jgi:hypothetical protein